MTQPKLITKPFAGDALPGYVNEIPKENPVGAPEQNASWSEGFPPITMTDIDDGGLPPNGEDMNGVLRAITEHNLFIGGGGVYEFTDEYITEVGGYSKGAVLVSDDKTALWMSIQDNNTQNFNGATKTQWRRIAFTELDSTLVSIQNALNTKADKSVTITAGDGLTGGGTLAGNRVLAVNSSVVRTDRTITAGTGLSGGGNLSANRTLSVNYGTTAGTAAQGNDSRITGAAQKSANLSDLVNAGAARQSLGLGTAATRDVGTDSGNVMGVGAGGWLSRASRGSYISGYPQTYNQNISQIYRREHADNGVAPFAASIHFAALDTWGRVRVDAFTPRAWIQGGRTNSGWTAELLHTDNILSTTGQSIRYPMTQKAVTDALNTKANTSTQVIAGTGLSGGGNLSANRTLSVNYGTTAGTAAQGNDSRINNGQTAFGWGSHAAAGYVKTAGDQTIAGTKTFSSFPVTPSVAPTADYQAANKKYVDDSAIGVGQTWQDVKASRSLGVTYTNTTGKAITVIQVSEYAGGGDPVSVYVNGLLLLKVDQGMGPGWLGPVAFIVPPGATYSVIKPAYPNIQSWVELRS